MIEAAMVKEKNQVKTPGYHQRIVWVVTILLGFGFIMTLNFGYNSSTQTIGMDYFFAILKFLGAAFAGIISAMVIRKLDSRSLFKLAHWLVLAALILLILTWQFGVVVNGARRWLDIFGIRFQPVEIFKIALAFALAVVLSNVQMRYSAWLNRILSNAFFYLATAGSLLLIYMQPNHSAMLMIFAVIFVMLLLSKYKWQHVLAVSLIAGIALASLIWLSPEKRDRILAFFTKNTDRDNITHIEERYQVDRAMEAVASGGWLGVGLGHSIIRYSLPASSTDFVFAIIVEELGFIGGFLLLGAYLYLIMLSLSVAAQEKDTFLRLTGVGVVLFFTLNVIIHVAVNIDLAPTTGIPLPFISQGGTALLFHLISIGLILNLARRRDCGINDVK